MNEEVPKHATKGRKRKVVFAAVGLCVVILAAVAFWPGEKEPEYQGKKLSEWCETYQKYREPAAQEAIVAIGTNWLPLLVKWASYEPSKWRDRVSEVQYRLPPSIRYGRINNWLLTDRALYRAEVANHTFIILGARANCAIPSLAESARIKTNSCAILCLSSIGEAAFPVLAKLARDKRFSGRALAIECIGEMKDLGTNKVVAVELLCLLANEPDQTIAKAAIIALGNLAMEPTLTLKTVAKFVQSNDSPLTWAAIFAIGRFGTNAQPMAGELIKFLDHGNRAIRDEAANSIHLIAPELFATNGASHF